MMQMPECSCIDLSIVTADMLHGPMLPILGFYICTFPEQILMMLCA